MSCTGVSAWTMLLVLVLPCAGEAPIRAVAAPAAGSVEHLVRRVKTVGAEGRNNPDARDASRELARLGPEALLGVLRGMDDASPLAANWLRGAVDAIAEGALAQGRSLPAADLEAFVLDRGHAGRVRRLAYEWLARVDSTAPDRLIPGMLDDPSVELRRDAVARGIDAAQAFLDRDDQSAALAAYRKLFAASREPDQVEGIAKTLRALGDEPDVTRHFGFVQRWHLIAPFDNTNKAGFDAVYAPEQAVDLAAEHAGKAGPVRWIEHETPDSHGILDLNRIIGKHMGVVAYATAGLESPGARAIEIRAGSPNAIKIWLNGRLLFTRDEYHHGMKMDQYRAAGTLRAGRNVILVKVCQNEQTEDWAQNWTLQLRVCDPTGGGVQ